MCVGLSHQISPPPLPISSADNVEDTMLRCPMSYRFVDITTFWNWNTLSCCYNWCVRCSTRKELPRTHLTDTYHFQNGKWESKTTIHHLLKRSVLWACSLALDVGLFLFEVLVSWQCRHRPITRLSSLGSVSCVLSIASSVVLRVVEGQ